jgi:hypothetical protein
MRERAARLTLSEQRLCTGIGHRHKRLVMRLVHAAAAVTAAASFAAAGLAVTDTSATGDRRTPPVANSANGHKGLSGADLAKRNTKVARKHIEQVFNRQRPDLVARFVTPDVVWRGGTLGTVRGADSRRHRAVIIGAGVRRAVRRAGPLPRAGRRGGDRSHP